MAVIQFSQVVFAKKKKKKFYRDKEKMAPALLVLTPLNSTAGILNVKEKGKNQCSSSEPMAILLGLPKPGSWAGFCGSTVRRDIMSENLP